MKIAIILCATLAGVSSFVLPPNNLRLSTLLREETSDATASTFKGAESISAITKDVKTVFTSEDISKVLPHRYPFLLVDKVVEYEAGKVSLLSLTSSLVHKGVTIPRHSLL
jgi:hypothetical protein